MYRAVVDRTPLGLLVYRVHSDTDPGQLHVALANEHASAATGADMSQFVGLSMAEAFPGYLETGQPQQVLDRVWHGGERIDLGKLSYGDQNIQPGVYEVTSFPVDEQHVCIAYANITDKERLQAALDAKAIALESTNRALERSNASLEQFAYVASHDLQEPLRKIQAFGARIRSGLSAELDGKHSDYLARMINAAERMSTLISDLLMYSRVQSRDLPTEAIDLGEVLGGVLRDLEVAIARAGARVDVTPLPARVVGNATRLRQLFQNLISNALKFRREEVTTEVTVSATSADDHVVVTVRDNGIGLDPKYAKRIFRPFQRLHSRTEYPGTGIGLAVCHEIAARHGGDLRVQSTPGEGSAFTVRLRKYREP